MREWDNTTSWQCNISNFKTLLNFNPVSYYFAFDRENTG